MAPEKRSLKEDLTALRIDRSGDTGHRRPRMGILLVMGFLLMTALALGLFLGARFGWNPVPGTGAADVPQAVATRREAGGKRAVLSAGGYLIARYQVEVGSKITGRVVALEIKEGDMVRQGQVIARLEDSEIAAQVRQARASLAAARARLTELETGSRPQEIERARAEVARTEAQLANSEVILRRTERLVNDKVLEPQALDDAVARRDMARAELQAARESLELAQIGPRVEAIDLARAQLRQAEAELAFAEAQHENTIIRSPVSGTILDRYVDLGEMVTTGFTSDRGAKQALVAVADLGDLQVELDISEADIARVLLDQSAEIRPDAYPDRRYRGTVEYIAALADRQKATIQVKVRVEDPDAYLRPDMGAKVTFFEQAEGNADRPAAVLVPREAVFTRGGGRYVYLVKESRVVLQPVKVGNEERGYLEILDGLQGGERVITGGQQGLKEGDRIR